MILGSSLKEDAATLFGVELGASQLEAFAWYARELSEWNRRFNLTAIADPAEIETLLFLDSLSCLKAMGPDPAGRLADVGSGAGFPGIPLKIARPSLQVTLIEATGKKADFCRHVVEGLGLREVEVVHARAEEAARRPEHRVAYDWAAGRAVAPLPVLLEYLLPLLKVGGLGIAQRGAAGPAEARDAAGALEILGGRVQRVVGVELPRLAGRHYLVVVEKTSVTPEKYPRRPGMAKKKPLGSDR